MTTFYCVDEVSANVENSRSIPLDPKEYLKSLNKLDGFLQKQNQWFKALEIKSLEQGGTGNNRGNCASSTRVSRRFG